MGSGHKPGAFFVLLPDRDRKFAGDNLLSSRQFSVHYVEVENGASRAGAEGSMPKARDVSTPLAREGELRLRWPPAVTARCNGVAVAGYADRLTGGEACVQALEQLPALAGDCELVFDLPLGQASAHGLISAVDSESRSFRVTLDQLETNGFLLLATVLMEEGLETGPL